MSYIKKVTLIFTIFAFMLQSMNSYPLAPKSSIPHKHYPYHVSSNFEDSELIEMIVRYQKEQNTSFGDSFYDFDAVVKDPKFQEWVNNTYLFNPFKKPKIYQGWKYINQLKETKNTRSKHIQIAYILTITSILSIISTNTLPLLLGLFLSLISTPLLTNFFLYLKKSPKKNTFVTTQTFFSDDIIRQLHQDKPNNSQMPHIGGINISLYELRDALVHLKKAFYKTSPYPESVLIIGPGLTPVDEIIQLIETFPKIKELHIVLLKNTFDFASIMEHYLEEHHLKIKIVFHKTSVLALPPFFQNKFDLIMMRRIMDPRFFSMGQLRQMIVDIFNSLKANGILIGHHMELQAYQNLNSLNFLYLYRPLFPNNSVFHNEQISVFEHISDDSITLDNPNILISA